MTGNLPTIMVSSTYYDLRQIRADIAEFIQEQLGYRVLISESHAFPVDPNADAIENCRQRVEKNADILLLFVGGRYGFVDLNSHKSVTNLEYLAARAKGIPIYAFIERRVLALLSTWKQNPSASFSHDVDNPALFDFIVGLRERDRIWTHEFEAAKDILVALRTQFAYLFHSSLETAARLQRSPLKHEYDHVSAAALRLALERPPAWEYRLFAQTLCDEIEKSRDLRYDHSIKLSLGFGDDVSSQQFTAWTSARLGELRRLIKPLEHLVNVAAADAFGPPGTPGDAQKIVSVGRRIAAVYRHSIEWAQRLRRANVDRVFRRIPQEMAQFTDDIIGKIESLGPDSLRRIDDALNSPPGSEKRNLNLVLAFGMPNFDNFQKSLDEALNSMQSGVEHTVDEDDE